MLQDPGHEYSAPEQWDILTEHLGWYGTQEAQVRVFHCLEMKHPEAEGTQRIRCYPFANHTFQDRNIMDPVFFLPMEPKEDFALPEDKDLLEYGRVVLLFSVLLPGHLGKYREHDLAMVRYMDRYRVKGNNS
jgi:hypothetical protein